MSQHVLIIGLGLIGGSIALAIKKNHDVHITACDINEDQLKLAQSLNVIDSYSLDMEEAAQYADLIIVAAPVMQSETILDKLLSNTLKQGAIVTDVGSTKEILMRKADRFLDKGVVYIGGHPMAGSHKSGVAAAKAHLFENAFYILTKNDNIDESKLDQLKHWLAGTKAHFVKMTPWQHDRVVGMISHFPHIIAASLVHNVRRGEQETVDLRRLAAGGFRDITRIASSNPTMWRDIVLHNRDALLSLMDVWQTEMDAVRKMISHGSEEELHTYFQAAKEYRDGLPEKKKGAIPAFYDLFVDVEDESGVIARVTSILAEEKINLTNIRIIETREDIMGVLRLSFRSDPDRDGAKTLLEQHQFPCYIVD
jgi:prephenate dehydrogenase